MLLYSFADLFNVCNVITSFCSKRQQDSHSTSAFNLLEYAVLVEVNAGNSASRRHGAGKGRRILVVFLVTTDSLS